MKLSAVDKSILRRALRLAIESDDSLIDAYRVSWSKRGGAPKKVLSEDGKRVAARCRRYIAGYKRMLAAVGGKSDGPETSR